MSLAFALTAAISGPTGSSATLSHGLKAPSLTGVSRRQQGILTPHG